MDIYNENFIIVFLINLVITFVAYCGVPIFLRLLNGKYEYEKGKRIILINCVIVCFIFILIKTSQGVTAQSGAVIFYYYINKAILLKAKDEHTETEDEIEKEEIPTKISLSNSDENKEKYEENAICYTDVKIHEDATNKKNEPIENGREEKKDNIVEEKKKYCTKCGKPIEQEWLFCNYCGNKLK